MTTEQLERMRQCSVEHVPKSSLTDIRDIEIDTGLSGPARMLRYIERVQNPYCFLCGGIPVQISFVNEERELSRVLADYFSALT